MMIWHIFRKDWRLLRVPVVGVGILQLAAALYSSWWRRVGSVDYRPNVLAGMIVILGPVFLIGAVVYADRAVGFRHDWRIRPILRLDMLWAKVLFIALPVQGPSSLAETFGRHSYGLTWSQALGQSLVLGAVWMLMVSVPALALASMFEGAMAMVGAGMLFLVLIIASFLNVVTSAVGWAGMAWIGESVVTLLILVASVVVLQWTYLGRRSVPRLAVFAIAICLIPTLRFIPFDAAFAVQEFVGPHSRVGRNVQVVYQAGRQNELTMNGPYGLLYTEPGDPFILTGVDPIPVFIATGLPTNARLVLDRYEIAMDTEVLASDTNAGLYGDEESSRNGIGGLIPIGRLSSARFPQVAKGRMRFVLHLTMLQLRSEYALPAVGGRLDLPGVGSCQTRVVSDSVLFQCTGSPNLPSCFTMALEDPATGAHNPQSSSCRPDYTPFSDVTARNSPMNMMYVPLHSSVPNRPYPIGAEQVGHARVVMRTYEPVDHFERRVEIPEVRP